MPKLTGASDAGTCSAAGYLVVNIMYSPEFIDVEDEAKDVGRNSHCEGKAGGQHLEKVPAFLSLQFNYQWDYTHRCPNR